MYKCLINYSAINTLIHLFVRCPQSKIGEGGGINMIWGYILKKMALSLMGISTIDVKNSRRVEGGR